MSETPNITCVKCTSVLDRATFEGLEVDHCPSCGGLWLDRGEITRAARLPEAELDRLRALVADTGGPPAVPVSNASRCPVCPGSLNEVVLGNVRVDYCGSCHGLFLDKGELEDAIRAVKARDTRATGQMVVAAAVSAAG